MSCFNGFSRTLFTGTLIAAASLVASSAALAQVTQHAGVLSAEPEISYQTWAEEASDSPQIERFRLNESSRNVRHAANKPDLNALIDIFLALSDKGYLDPSLDKTIPDEETLTDVYDYAVDSGLIGTDASRLQSDLRSLQPNQQLTTSPSIDSLQTSGAPGSPKALTCKQSAAKCVGVGFVAAAACVLTADTAGLLAPACYTTVAAAGLACSPDVATNCPSSSKLTDSDYSAGRRGTVPTGVTKTTHVCSGTNRVNDIDVYGRYSPTYSGNVVTGIEITCSKSNTYYKFANAPKDTYYGGSSCGTNPWNLAQGLTIRAGSVVDAVAIECDQTFDTSVANWIGTLYGGTGGTKTSQKCTEGQYMVGLNTWHNASDANPIITAIEVICRTSKAG